MFLFQIRGLHRKKNSIYILNGQDLIRIDNDIPQTNLEISVEIAAERASPDDKATV